MSASATSDANWSTDACDRNSDRASARVPCSSLPACDARVCQQDAFAFVACTADLCFRVWSTWEDFVEFSSRGDADDDDDDDAGWLR